MHTHIHTYTHACIHACMYTYIHRQATAASPSTLLPPFFFLSTYLRTSANVVGPMGRFPLAKRWGPVHGSSFSPGSCAQVPPQKNSNPNCLVSLALELCLVGQFGSADRLRAVFPLTLRKRVLASSPLLSNPDCPTRDQGRVDGTKYSRGDEWGQGSIPEPYAATVIELTYCTVACMW